MKNLSSADHQKGLLITVCAGEHGVLEEGAVEGDVVRDAVDDDRVLGRGVEGDCADAYGFGLDGFALELGGHLVDALDQRSWERVFHAVEHADLLHLVLSPLPAIRGLSVWNAHDAR